MNQEFIKKIIFLKFSNTQILQYGGYVLKKLRRLLKAWEPCKSVFTFLIRVFFFLFI